MFSRAKVTADLVRASRMFARNSRRRRLPVQQPPKLIERAYAEELAALVVPRIRAALGPLLAALPGMLERAKAERRIDQEPGWTSRAPARMAAWWRRDAGEGKQARQLLEAARQKIRGSISTAEIEALAEKFARRTATYQRIQLGRQVNAALGVDVAASDKRLPPLIDAFVDANVGLVKDIGDRVAARVESEVLRAVQDGSLHGDIAGQIEKIGFGEERAKLIARDQVGKLYGQINATRQGELGIQKFIWRSSGDERVRDLHEELDGQEFSYAEGGHPTEGLPGEPVLCRCWAEPVFDEILEEVAEPVDEPPEPEEKKRDPDPAPRFVEPEPVAFARPEPEPERAPVVQFPAAAAPEILPAVAELAAAEAAPAEVVEFVPKKNPKRVEAAKKAAEASHERRREIHSAVASNLPPELQVAWQAEGHKFMREEAGRIRGVKDRVNAASKLSEAFAEKYGSGEASVFGNEGDRFAKRAELESKHAEEWANEQEREYYEQARREMIESGELDEHGNPTAREDEPVDWGPPPATLPDDEDPPF